MASDESVCLFTDNICSIINIIHYYFLRITFVPSQILFIIIVHGQHLFYYEHCSLSLFTDEICSITSIILHFCLWMTFVPSQTLFVIVADELRSMHDHESFFETEEK